MAYQALYRKYRPTEFDEVVGQKHIVQTLKNAVERNRIAHAYLFCGPRGTGKTSIAKIFARMLNCEDPNHKPCGKCLNCQMALNGSHPDIIEIDAASNNGVDEVRNLIDKVKYAPLQGKYKVYIIDEVHMMSTGAFNALLKTIEEPPAHVIFIFATTEPNKVIPTIISRCQRFDFSKVPLSEIQKRLRVVCESEKINIDENAIRLIAQLSDGGMRDSLSILDQCTAYCVNSITEDDVRQIYGVITTDDIGQIFHAAYKRNVDELISKLQNADDKGMDLRRLTQSFISLLKDSIILDYSPESKLVSDNHKEVINKYFIESPSLFRVELMNELMDSYNKFNFASSVLDYLEAAILKPISKSYESPVRETVNISDVKHEDNMKLDTKGTESSYDKVSENPKYFEKTPILEDKKEEIEEKDISDVSRETLEQVEKAESKIILNDEYVIQLLVGANKRERQSDNEKINEKDVYLSDLKYGKFASLLRDMKIIASGNNYIVVNVRNEIIAKEINEMQLNEGFESFMNVILGKPKKVFAIDNAQCSRVVDEFKERMINGTLPEPAEVIIHSKHIEAEEEQTPESMMKSLFPNIEIIDD